LPRRPSGASGAARDGRGRPRLPASRRPPPCRSRRVAAGDVLPPAAEPSGRVRELSSGRAHGVREHRLQEFAAHATALRALLNEQKIADRSSRMDLRRNTDGSVDIYCGPTAPAGFGQNWIPTVPGKNWFAYFRFYQPTDAYLERSWPLPDFEQV